MAIYVKRARALKTGEDYGSWSPNEPARLESVNASYVSAAAFINEVVGEPAPPTRDVLTSVTQELILYDFGFTLPLSDRVIGVSVRFVRDLSSYADEMGTPPALPDVRDETLELGSWDGTTFSAETSDKADATTGWVDDGDHTYTGEPVAFWGWAAAPTPVALNASTFAVRLVARGARRDTGAGHTWADVIPSAGGGPTNPTAMLDLVEVTIETQFETGEVDPEEPEPEVCASALALDRFVVDGWQFPYIPSLVAVLPDRGVRASSVQTLGLKRVVSFIKGPLVPPVTKPDLGPAHRGGIRQRWGVAWDEKSPVHRDLRDFLVTLQNTGASFWWQFDDELSYEKVRLLQSPTDARVFLTPTWPIAPFGYTPLNEYTWTGMARTNGVPTSLSHTIDNDYGLVIFDATVDTADIVDPRLSYTFKCYGKIVELGFEPVRDTCQEFFTGQISIAQLRPDLTYDPWNGDWVESSFTSPVDRYYTL